MHTLLENEWIRVELLSDKSTIAGTWKEKGRQVISEEEFQAIFTAILEALKDYDVENWADDTTNMGVVLVGCQRWMVGDFFPKAIANGLKKISIINSKDIFAVSAVKNVLNKISGEVEVEIFDSREKAERWIVAA